MASEPVRLGCAMQFDRRPVPNAADATNSRQLVVSSYPIATGDRSSWLLSLQQSQSTAQSCCRRPFKETSLNPASQSQTANVEHAAQLFDRERPANRLVRFVVTD